MSWPSQFIEASNNGRSKVRKRGSTSSSSSSSSNISSSSSFKKYRFKRAIVIKKKPEDFSKCTPQPNSVSARKLGASLWEFNKVHDQPRLVKKNLNLEEEIDYNSNRKKKMEQRSSRDRDRVSNTCRVGNLPPHLSDPSHNPVSQRMDKDKGAIHGSVLEIEKCSFGKYRNGSVIQLKDLKNGLITSKELLKVLNHVCGLEEKHTSSISIVSALRVELDRARLQVDKLIKNQCSNQNEVEYLLKQFAEEKAAWRSRERERIRVALSGMAEQFEVEKKLRRQSERLNKKIGKELMDTKENLSKALKELECEKRAKEILEQVCEEFAKDIGEDRAAVQEFKNESAKIWEEVEKEREMLQLADILREERVQMKLSDAKYHFEEKNEAVERLKQELESYLTTTKQNVESESPDFKRIQELESNYLTTKQNADKSPDFTRIQELEAYLKEINFGSQQDERIIVGADNDEEQDSGDSDLHSIELSMDDINKNYKWSYVSENGNAEDNKKVLVNGLSEIAQWKSGNHQEYLQGLNRESSDDLLLQIADYEDEIERYKSVERLRDHILSGSKRAFASPTRQWGESLPMQDPENGYLPGKDLKPMLLGPTRGEARVSTTSM